MLNFNANNQLGLFIRNASSVDSVSNATNDFFIVTQDKTPALFTGWNVVVLQNI
jgi:hypothetical protein